MINLLDKNEQRINLGKAGRQYVESYHDWSVAATRLVEMYSQVISDGKSQTDGIKKTRPLGTK